MSTILITPRSLTTNGHPALDRLVAAGHEILFSAAGRQPTEGELLALVPGCIGYLAGVEPVTAPILQAAAELQVISRNGTGVDNIDLEAAARCGIRICRAEGVNAQGVAELTIGMLLAMARSIPFCDHRMKAGDWLRRKGMEFRGKTLGLIGCGKIGRLVAEMALGLGLNVIAYDVSADPLFKPSERFCFAALDEVLSSADAISLHCPPLPDGRPVVDAAALCRVRRGTWLINTARYDLLDAAAVTAALDDGRLAGVAIDVFDHEPPTDRRLIQHERVIATPHIGGFTEESVDRAVSVAVDNLLNHLQIASLVG